MIDKVAILKKFIPDRRKINIDDLNRPLIARPQGISDIIMNYMNTNTMNCLDKALGSFLAPTKTGKTIYTAVMEARIKKDENIDFYMINTPNPQIPIDDLLIHYYIRTLADANVSTLNTAFEMFKHKKKFDVQPFKDLQEIWDLNEKHQTSYFPKKTYYIVSNSVTVLDIQNINWLRFKGVNKKVITTESNKQKILKDSENYPIIKKLLEEDPEFEIVGLDVHKVNYQSWKQNFEEKHNFVYLETGPTLFKNMHKNIESNIRSFYKNDYSNIKEYKDKFEKERNEIQKLLPITETFVKNLPVEIQTTKKQYEDLFTPIDTLYLTVRFSDRQFPEHCYVGKHSNLDNQLKHYKPLMMSVLGKEKDSKWITISMAKRRKLVSEKMLLDKEYKKMILTSIKQFRENRAFQKSFDDEEIKDTDED